tara:strand:- start:726 stop:2849 length:2124 start_codon:yes stop_codon:yes gene_type:complete
MTLHLNDLSQIYLDQISEKKDDSYLETDMKKRQKNNEKAISDMKKVKDDTKPRWMREGKKLDPVGQEDADIDNDGDVDKSDKYLHKKRKAIGKAISKKKGGDDEDDEEEKVEEGVIDNPVHAANFKKNADNMVRALQARNKKKQEKTRKEEYEVELDEFKVTKLDKSKVKERAKNIKSIRDKKAALADLMKHYKGMKTGVYNSYEPEGEMVDEKIDVRKQSSKRKSLGRGSSINPDAKSTGYESPKEFRKTEKKLAPYMEAKNVHGEVEVPSKNIKKLASKANKRIDTDVDGDVENNDNSKGKYGEFVSTSDGKGRLFTGPKKVTKESVSNWRQDLIEVADEDSEKQIKEMPKNQKNKVNINPKLGEAVEGIGGTLLEEVEIDELDVIINTIYDEFLEEGYTEDEIEDAFEVVLLDEATITYGHDSKGLDPKEKSKQSKLQGRMRYIKRKVGEKLSTVKSKAKEKFGMASAKAQVAAYNKARELSQKASDVKNRSKTSLKRFVGKQAQKVVDRMKEEVDIEESIQSEVQVTPQEVQLQRKSASIDKKLASIRQRKVQKQTSAPAKSMNEGTTECVHSIKGKDCPVHGNKDCSSMDEATEDSLRDRRMERGGVDGNNRYNKPVSNTPNTFGKKKPVVGGPSALDIVKAQIRAKHGQGAIKEDAKMAKQSDENLAALHKQVSGSDQSLPSNQFMMKRVTKEMNRRKKAS